MRKQGSFILAGLLFLQLFSSCKTSYSPQALLYNDYRISNTTFTRQDSAMNAMLRPYADSVSRSMNIVIAVSATELEKKQPEGTLGNVMADVMYVMASKYYKTKIDAAFINYGGIRLTSIPAGNISRGKVFELAPFDNIMVLQRLKGDVFQAFLDHVAAKGGWPSAGVTWQIKNNRAINIMVGGAPLDPAKEYMVANNDYVANGGDDCDMLRSIPQVNGGYLYRDAVLEYFAQLNREGKKVSAQIENRVTDVN